MKILKFQLVLLSIILAVSCNIENNDDPGSKASLQITLTDAPTDYGAVWIDVQDVKIKSGSDSSWQYIENVNRGMYNLLELTGGVDTLIAQSLVDTGFLVQIRLVLGENNYLVMDGDSIHLTTPSAQQSGLKISLNEKLNADVNYKLVIDFDASKSIVEAGKSGKYILKPVIRAFMEAQDGAIMGSIADTIPAVVYAIQDADSMSSYPDSTGKFIIQGLPEGNYNVFIDAGESWIDSTLTDIMVETGKVSNLGYIELDLN